MTTNTIEIEGTWEEIASQASRYAGRKMRLTVLPEVVASPSAPDQPSLDEKLAAISDSIPVSELAKLPADLGEQLDHYVYGTQKR